MTRLRSRFLLALAASSAALTLSLASSLGTALAEDASAPAPPVTVQPAVVVVPDGAVQVQASPAADALAAACYEDEPCFVWSRDGDRRRGVVLRSGKKRVVGPVGFCRLDRAHRIDWKRTPRLRGDHTARSAC